MSMTQKSVKEPLLPQRMRNLTLEALLRGRSSHLCLEPNASTDTCLFNGSLLKMKIKCSSR